MPQDNLDGIRLSLAYRLEDIQRAGITQLPIVAAGLRQTQLLPKQPPPAQLEMTPSSPPDERLQTSEITKRSGWQTSAVPSLFQEGGNEREEVIISTAATLEVLQQEVSGCGRCKELARTRTQTVFGVGKPNARLCFLGEAPGADEDRLGEPFVGRAGQLLTKIIEACQMKREDVYILNMIKCRPPGNRNPLPVELSNCRGFLERQIDLIQPEFICCLGAVAAQNLLGTSISIGKLRGKIHSYRGLKVVCTYHPAFLLRSPSFKKQTWEDMQLLMREMGVNLG